MENKYYNIRVKNKDGTNDYLVRMHVHEYYVDWYVSSQQVIEGENFIVYKELINN